MRDVLEVLERYYDGVPRRSATAEDFGALTLFVPLPLPGNFPFYARPTLGYGEPAEPSVIAAVRARQRELGLPEAFEWVTQTSPSLAVALTGAGLAVRSHPLLLATADRQPTVAMWTTVLGADDPDVARAVAVVDLAFGTPGTGRGVVGLAELTAEADRIEESPRVARTRNRIRAGHAVLAAAYDENGELIAAGQHNPLAGVSEIVGVGTLPAARRRGAGAAVTATLIADARAGGVATVFLSATDEAVARVYRRVGSTDVGTAMIAEPV